MPWYEGLDNNNSTHIPNPNPSSPTPINVNPIYHHQTLTYPSFNTTSSSAFSMQSLS